jgi:hypothetical protein
MPDPSAHAGATWRATIGPRELLGSAHHADPLALTAPHALDDAGYRATRALYPLLYGKNAQGGAPTRIVLVTFIGYGIVAFLALSLTWAALHAAL